MIGLMLKPPYIVPEGAQAPRLERLAAISAFGIRLKQIEWLTSPLLPQFGVPAGGLMITALSPRLAWHWVMRDGTHFVSPPLIHIGFRRDDPAPLAHLN